MLDNVLTALPAFFAYFGVAALLIAGFLLIYVNVTPYEEFALIRAGNPAAAVSLAGALLGFAMPVANAIAHSDTIADLAVWGAIACAVQVLAYLVVRVGLPTMRSDIHDGRVAPAILLASISVSIGLINAACMSY